MEIRPGFQVKICDLCEKLIEFQRFYAFEQESGAAILKQAVKSEAEISATVLAELSEKSRIDGDPSKADHLLLLAWAAYDEADKSQTDIGLCSSEKVVA